MGRPVSFIRFAIPSAILAALAVILLVNSGSALGVTLDPGDILITDSNNAAGRIIRVNPITGAPTLVASGGYLATPYGIALAANGDLIVADSGRGAIIRVNPITGA